MKKISFLLPAALPSCKLLIKDELTSLFGVSDVLIDHKTEKGR